jgi:predicted metalloprotease
MRWTPGGRSEDVEDLRGSTGGSFVRRGLPIGIGGFLLLLVISLLTGRDFLSLIGGLEQATVQQQPAPAGDGPLQTTPEEERLVEFVSDVLDDAQATWASLLPNRYRRTKLVLFRDAIQSACGFAQTASGPFYCPSDEKVYIDLGFYGELRQRFGAPGDFAQAYVIAHEIGHHVQRVVGIEEQVRDLQQRRPDQVNALSVRLELQADCLAGVWGHAAAQRGQLTNERQVALEPGDMEDGLRAAAAIGDDRIQHMSGSRVQPESFTHGSSVQRVEWLRRGLQGGNADACDTFGAGRGTS